MQKTRPDAETDGPLSVKDSCNLNRHFAVYREDDGRFSAFAVDLPGTVSHGDSVEEALDNIRDALECNIATYLATDGDVPWVKDGAWTPDGPLVHDVVENRSVNGG